MVTLQDRFRPNHEEVAAKITDGEAIIINFSSGVYYSMDKVGGLIWKLIEEGHRIGEIVVIITARYQVQFEQAQEDLERLVENLLQEKLVMVSDHAVSSRRYVKSERRQAMDYEPPELNIYTDMEDLLAFEAQ